MLILQEELADCLARKGGLWSSDKIMLRLIEEVGEASRAFRKESASRQAEEVGDIGFTILALCEREGLDFELVVLGAIARHLGK